MDLHEFLTWLTSSAGATALFSFVAQRWPGWADVAPATQGWIHLGASMGIGLLAYAVLVFAPPDVLAVLAPWFQVVYGLAAAWVANQVAHGLDPARRSPGDASQ